MEEKAKLIVDLLKSEQPKLGVMSVTCTKLEGTGYCSDMCRVHVHFTDINKQKKTLVAKCMRKNNDAWMTFEDRAKTFTTEAKILRVLPVLETLLHKASFSEEDCMIGPRYICSEADNSCIVMEDLKAEGFEVLERTAAWGPEEGKLAIRALGRLHGAAFVAFQQGLIQKDSLEENFFIKDIGDLNKYYQDGFELLAETLESCEGEKRKKFIKWLRSKAALSGSEMKKISTEDPTNLKTLCHGDFWNCNIMFKKAENEKYKFVRLIDFQICHYGSVGWDLVFFFYTQPHLALYLNHYDEMLATYVNEVNECLKKLNSDFEFLSVAAVKAEMARMEFVGLVLVVGDLPHIMGKTKALEESDDLLSLDRATRRELCKNEAFLQTISRYLETTTFDFTS